MFEKMGLTRMAQALASHSATRISAISRNIANSDTPKFKAYDVKGFDETYGRPSSIEMHFSRPGHFNEGFLTTAQFVAAPDSEAPNGNDVSLDVQMLKASETKQSHGMALAIYKSASTLVQTSLGRR